MKPDRKEFIRTAFLFAGGGFGLAHLLACGGDSPSPSGTGGNSGAGGAGTAACATNGPTATIATNHTGALHTLTISMADATAGVQRTYSIMGNSAHDHSVTISPTNFTMLKAGMTIAVVSTSAAGHTHSVSVTCT